MQEPTRDVIALVASLRVRKHVYAGKREVSSRWMTTQEYMQEYFAVLLNRDVYGGLWHVKYSPTFQIHLLVSYTDPDGFTHRFEFHRPVRRSKETA